MFHRQGGRFDGCIPGSAWGLARIGDCPFHFGKYWRDCDTRSGGNSESARGLRRRWFVKGSKATATSSKYWVAPYRSDAPLVRTEIEDQAYNHDWRFSIDNLRNPGKQVEAVVSKTKDCCRYSILLALT